MQEIVNPKLDPIYEAPKGAKFKIVADGNLFAIRMLNGGVLPGFANERYTSFKKAKAALDRYFEANPKPIPRTPSKVVVKDNKDD